MLRVLVIVLGAAAALLAFHARVHRRRGEFWIAAAAAVVLLAAAGGLAWMEHNRPAEEFASVDDPAALRADAEGVLTRLGAGPFDAVAACVEDLEILAAFYARYRATFPEAHEQAEELTAKWRRRLEAEAAASRGPCAEQPELLQFVAAGRQHLQRLLGW